MHVYNLQDMYIYILCNIYNYITKKRHLLFLFRNIFISYMLKTCLG